MRSINIGAQLVDKSLPTAEVHGSSPVIGKISIECIEKTEINKKRPGIDQFLLKQSSTTLFGTN